MEKFKKLIKCINEEIKAGDTVRIIDGSGLCCEEYPEKDFYIVYAYAEIGGDLIHTRLENIDCAVLDVQMSDVVSYNTDTHSISYLLDVRVKCGNLTFRTCSNFLRKTIKNTRTLYDFGAKYTLTEFYDIIANCPSIDVNEEGEHLGSIIGLELPDPEDPEQIKNFNNEVINWIVDNSF